MAGELPIGLEDRLLCKAVSGFIHYSPSVVTTLTLEDIERNVDILEFLDMTRDEYDSLSSKDILEKFFSKVMKCDVRKY
jgi:hypothetical protein